jgi:chromosome segregation ATPase
VPHGVDVLRRRSVLVELRRLLAQSGILVMCGGSADRRGAPGGASFYEFRDRLERMFPPVRMMAQLPFVGFSLVEYGADGEPPAIELDTSLLELSGGEAEPSDYVAVCGGRAAAPRGLTVVQLPDRQGLEAVTGAVIGRSAAADLAGQAAPGPGTERVDDPIVTRELRLRLESAIAERARAQAQSAELKAQVAELRRKLAAAEELAAMREVREVEPAREEAREMEPVREPEPVRETEPTREAPSLAEAEEVAAAPGLASPSQAVAQALAAHRDVVRSLEIAVEEGQAYADELTAELAEARARGEASEAARGRAEERAERLLAELREWRSRASNLEGQMLRLASAAEAGQARPRDTGGVGQVAAPISLASGTTPNGQARVAELERELAELQRQCGETEHRLEAAARGAAQAASRAERERDELAARLRQAEDAGPPPRASISVAERASAGSAGRRSRSDTGIRRATEMRDRINRVEGELGTGRDLLQHIEEGLAVLEQEASRDGGEPSASAYAAHRDQQLRELSAELGIKDAEITILHVGVTALRARLKGIIEEVRRAAGAMRGRSAPEMLDVMDQLSARLNVFEERE